jgi:FkbM family methyltransferase
MLIQLLSRITRQYPLYSPRYSILSRLPSAPPAPRGFVIKRGLVIRNYYPGDDYISKNLFWFGEFEPWVLRALEALAVTGGNALDIGANVGLMTLWMARKLGPAGSVLSFEPNPPTYRKLLDNVNANFGIAHVDVFQFALSDRNGTVRLSVPADQSGQACIEVEESGGARADLTVEMRRLDDVLRDCRNRRFCVCKIDVEGHEERVLAGMEDVLARKQVESFVFERHLPLGEQDNAIRLLGAAGYEVLRIFKRPMTISLAPSGVHAAPGRTTDDFIAVLRDSEAQRRIARWTVRTPRP